MKERKNKRILQSRDVKGRAEGTEPELPPMTGPRTGMELTLTPGQWLERNATPEQMTMFREIVDEARAKIAATDWRTLPGGLKIPMSQVLAFCGQCKWQGWTFPEHADGGTCVICGQNPATGGPGKLRRTTKAEVKAWYVREEARLAKIKADAPKRAKDLADFNKRRFQDVGKDER